MSDRPLSRCAMCGQTDDHPKHQQLDASEPGECIYRHMDCCTTDVCHDDLCAKTLKSAGSKRGDALLEHITSGGK